MQRFGVAALVCALAVPSVALAQGKSDEDNKQGKQEQAPGNSGSAPGHNKDAEGKPGPPAQQETPASEQGQAQGRSEEAPGRSDQAPRGEAKGHDKNGAPKNDTAGDDGDNGNGKGKSQQAKAKSNDGGSDKPKANNGSDNAGAGKVTICHATGSATNPYVTITISRNALPAHQRHQDGRDIIPAPAGGCPGGTRDDDDKPAAAKDKKGKVTICHATGSATNPYVVITISESALPAHQRHQDGRDIIPAPAGGCPAEGATPPAGSDENTVPPSAVAATGAAGAPGPAAIVASLVDALAAPAAERVAVLGSSLGSADDEASSGMNEQVEVLGASLSGSTPEAAAAPAVDLDADEGGSLPFTGRDLGIIVAIALAVALAGFALRRAAAQRSI